MNLDLGHWQEVPASTDLYDPRLMSPLMTTSPPFTGSSALKLPPAFDASHLKWPDPSDVPDLLQEGLNDQNNLMLWNNFHFGSLGAPQGLSSSLTADAHSALPEPKEPVDPSQKRSQGSSNLPSGCPCTPSILRALESSPVNTKTNKDTANNPAITLDILLATNKTAISQCITMLSCACFGSSTSFLLLSALLNQTLGLYQLACEDYLARSQSNSNPPPPSASAPAPTTQNTALNDPSPSPRLDFGAYRIEAEDDMLLKRELVLLELRKVGALLDRFRERIGKVRDRVESSTYDGLLAQMTRCLQRTVLEVQSRR